MAGDKESTLVFKVDGTQAETGVAKVKRSLNDLADTANREGQRGAAGIAGMGAGAEKSAAQIERATQRQISEIRRMTAELESGGKATRAYQEAMASIRGVDSSALRPYLDQLEAIKVKRAEIANQTASADNFVAGLRGQIAALREQIALQGMSTEEVMRYRAAQAGAASAAAPLILQLQNMRAAQSAVAEAARAEAAAQKQAAAASADRTSFIQSLQSQASAIGKTRAELLELKAAQLGVTQQAAPFIAKLREAETGFGKVGATAAQTANQMRMVAPQITDIVTQLASGQSAFTIFIQQGGQLKDMFGGVGNAAKAIGTYVMGLVNPFTLAAGAAALLATAYYQGSKESAAYNTAIVMSGNAAGVTAGQLGDMARAMESATRTQSAASAALAEMAQNSRVGSDELQRYTTIALDFEKVTGTAVSKTAEAFASLAKEPLQAALKLNDGVNWLTTSTYEHIKSLEEQGRKTDAARVAQEAYANSIAQKTAQLQGNLGALERGWNSLAGAAKSAWSAMLNIGRSETLGDQLNNARATLDARMQRGPINEGVRGAWETGNERLKQQIALLSEQERMLKRGAEAQAAANAQVQARIALDSKYGDKLKTDAQKAKAARDEIAELGKAAGKSADEIKKLQDASDATFNRGGGGGRKGGGAGRTSAAPGENEIARIKAMIEEEQRYIAALQERGKEAEKLTAGEKLVLKLQQELQTSMSGVAKANKEKALAAAQELVSVEKVRVAEEKRIKADEENRKRLIASIDEERAARMKLAEENAKRVDSIGKDNDRMREEIETLGLSAAQIAARTIEVNNATIAEKENQLARLQNDDISTREMAALEEEIKLLKERNGLIGSKAAKQGAIDAAKQVEDEWKKTADSINQSLTDALLRGFESGKDFGKNFRDTLVNMFKTLVLRPVISFIVQPIGNSISGMVSGFLGGGQGGAGGIGGMVSNGSSLLNLFNGGASDLATMFGFGEAGAGSIFDLLGSSSMGALDIGGVSAGAIGGLAAVAAPLIIGALAESATRDRFSGAAFATSNWAKDPTVTIGGAEYDPIKGILPDHDALVGRALEAGISQEMIDRFKDKDRALLHYIRMLDSNRQSGNEGPPINVNALLENDNMYAADWYRGQGYAHPQAMGWWNDKGYDLASNDPAITTASRAVATSIVAPLTEINRILGGAAEDFRVTAGYATRGEGKGVWAGLNISQGENNLVDWVDMDSFNSPQEAVKGMYEQALGALEKLDLPKWAQEQVDGAQAAMAGLSGDKMGEEAAALYAQTAGSIAQTISAIKLLIDVFPDFAGQTQDTVHAIATAMGGLQNLTTAYNSYLEGFYSEEERRALALKQLGAQFADLGVALPDSRDAFRALVESQDLSTEAGQRMFAALMGLAGAFAAVTPAAESAADAAGRLADEARRLAEEAYSNARSRTDDVWARLQQLFNDQIDNWQKLADEARAIFDIATDAARQLRGEVADTRAWDAMQGRDFIAQALAGLRGTGALPDSEALSRAIEGARAGLNVDGYTRVAEYEFDQLVLASQLQEIGDISGTQASFAEQQVDLLKDQMDHWRKQLEVLRGMDLNITTIAEGTTVLADAVRAEQAAQAALEGAAGAATGGAASVGGTSFGAGAWANSSILPGFASTDAEMEALRAQYFARDGHMPMVRQNANGTWSLFENTGARYNDSGGGVNSISTINELRNASWWGDGDWSKLVGYDLSVAASAGGVTPADLEEVLRRQGLTVGPGGQIRAFADGGYHSGGWRLVGERGPELEYTGPSAILNNHLTQRLLSGGGQTNGNADVVAELRAVQAQLADMRRQLEYQTENSDRQLSLNQRLTDNGDAQRVKVVTA